MVLIRDLNDKIFHNSKKMDPANTRAHARSARGLERESFSRSAHKILIIRGLEELEDIPYGRDLWQFGVSMNIKTTSGQQMSSAATQYQYADGKID